MSIEAMKRWLEALEYHTQQTRPIEKTNEAIDDLRQAIEQAQKQEPRNIRERWNIELDGDDLLVCFNDHERGEKCRYERYVLADTSPPQRQPLTDEEIRKAKHHMVEGAYHYSFQQGVRYAEAAHDIKGEA